ncbi:unnamed protein product [Adineta steineri]|uniref:Uncharacterized protein n=1 Tax=Adineta steineri TaxID=433720 RepID=A0A815QLJ5_9BILA|nr:unnamed protein product [Adineta steineri]CAF4147517.1 unnamed protein product [Adineta steineri]
MSNSSRNTINSNIAVKQMKSNDPAEISNSSNSSEKDLFSEDIDAQTKKIKIETPVLAQKASMPSGANAVAPKFMSAAAMVASRLEITDEEFLKFAIDFEREHGI